MEYLKYQIRMNRFSGQDEMQYMSYNSNRKEMHVGSRFILKQKRKPKEEKKGFAPQNLARPIFITTNFIGSLGKNDPWEQSQPTLTLPLLRRATHTYHIGFNS